MSSSNTEVSTTSFASEALSSISCATCCSRPRNAIWRRTRSMALLRPTLISHARGLVGGASLGQRSSATAKASCSTSSARSKSPTRRISVASARPASSRKIFSISPDVTCAAPSVINPDRPHLDRAIAMARAGNPCGDAKRGIEVLGLNQIIAAELLARFRERAVRGHDFSVLDAHGGRCRGWPQAVAGLEVPALDDVFGKDFKLVRHLLARRRIELGVLCLVRIDHQKILHGLLLFVRLDRRHISAVILKAPIGVRGNLFRAPSKSKPHFSYGLTSAL